MELKEGLEFYRKCLEDCDRVLLTYTRTATYQKVVKAHLSTSNLTSGTD